MFRYPLTCKSEWDKILFEKKEEICFVYIIHSLYDIYIIHIYNCDFMFQKILTPSKTAMNNLTHWSRSSRASKTAFNKKINLYTRTCIWKKYFHWTRSFYATYLQDLSFIKIRIWRLSKPSFCNSLLMFDGH